jgi:hypothetical protein
MVLKHICNKYGTWHFRDKLRLGNIEADTEFGMGLDSIDLFHNI